MATKRERLDSLTAKIRGNIDVDIQHRTLAQSCCEEL